MPSLSPRRVWIVEDDNITAFVIKRVIGKFLPDAECQIYGHGQAALDALSEAAPWPDLVLLDINMPVLSGWGFLEEAQEQHPGWSGPVFMLTSSIDPDDIERARRYPVVKGYHPKPITKEMLESILQEIA